MYSFTRDAEDELARELGTYITTHHGRLVTVPLDGEPDRIEDGPLAAAIEAAVEHYRAGYDQATVLEAVRAGWSDWPAPYVRAVCREVEKALARVAV